MEEKRRKNKTKEQAERRWGRVAGIVVTVVLAGGGGGGAAAAAAAAGDLFVLHGCKWNALKNLMYPVCRLPALSLESGRREEDVKTVREVGGGKEKEERRKHTGEEGR